MEKIDGYPVENLTLDDFTFVMDLIYFDGPLLSLYVDEKYHDSYLFYWVDVDSEANRWLISKTKLADVNDYLNRKIALSALLAKSMNVYLADIFDDDIQRCRLLPFTNLPQEYLPDEESFYKYEITSQQLYLNYYSKIYGDGILQIHFSNSTKVSYGTIDLTLFSKAISCFSEMSASLANSFYKIERNKQKQELSQKQGTTIDRTDFLKAIQLQMFGSQASSFAILLKTTDKELSFDNDLPTRADEYIKFLIEFISASYSIDRFKAFVDRGVEISAINHYENFLRVLEENRCNLQLNYLNDTTHINLHRQISRGEATSIIRNLQQFDYDETNLLSFEGNFISLNLKNGSYIFESEKDSSSGKLDSNTLMLANKIAFNKKYIITLERRIIKKAANKKPKKTDELRGFKEIGFIEEATVPEALF